jgi:hypothetical protein
MCEKLESNLPVCSILNLRSWDLDAKKMSDSVAFRWQIIVLEREKNKNKNIMKNLPYSPKQKHVSISDTPCY